MFKPRSEIYDLAPSVLDQVYGGLSKEDLSANDAVNQTRGEIITYGNMPGEIYFHSTCGGSTASSKNVWGKDVVYLKAVKCEHCRRSSLYRWKRYVNSDKVLKKLKKNGIKISKIDSIKLVYREKRVKSVVINGRAIPVNRFRAYVGYSFIWSNDFSVELKGRRLHFSGKGAGHGVGACQWGMAAMAKRGKLYSYILNYYFKNIELKKMY